MPRPRSRQELDHELRARKTDRYAAVAETAVRGGALVAVFGFIYLTANTLAGKVTLAQIGVNLFAQATVSETVAWIFGLCGTLYGLRQQKLRRDTIQTQSGRIIELETRHDPERSSSKLSERGTTHAEDLRR
jgi:hypothetical protein